MKKLLVAALISAFSLLSSAAYAEDEEAKLKNIEVSFGDSAFTSGLNIAMLFSLTDNRDFQLVGNSDRFYATLNFKVGDKLSLDATGGVFKKIPWVGPRVVYYPVKSVMLMYWGGVSAGRIGALAAEPKSFCQQFSAYVVPEKHLSLGYNIIKFDAYKTTQLPEVAYYQPLNENLRVGFSATYDTVAKDPLFCTSLMYTFK